MAIMASTARAIDPARPSCTATLMYEPRPGRRKSCCPSRNDSLIIRKNHPPAMLIMLFHTRPVIPKGSSTHLKRFHQSNRYTLDVSRRSCGTDFSEW